MHRMPTNVNGRGGILLLWATLTLFCGGIALAAVGSFAPTDRVVRTEEGDASQPRCRTMSTPGPPETVLCFSLFRPFQTDHAETDQLPKTPPRSPYSPLHPVKWNQR